MYSIYPVIAKMALGCKKNPDYKDASAERHTGMDAGIQRPWMASQLPSLALDSGFPAGMTAYLGFAEASY